MNLYRAIRTISLTNPAKIALFLISHKLAILKFQPALRTHFNANIALFAEAFFPFEFLF
ncbi:MAG: hypothetical protein ACD_63C00115G0002 [uncultured bacterium]|nr:MAG: hypothetical protein ACD_63C00115G0002 [uncultured bacterium]